MDNNRANVSKRVVKTQKGYAGDSLNEHRAIENANLELSKKEIGQQNENL
ncbi:hypothetical protein SAMN04488168_102116 [Bacillus sp. 491mf]|nr:MULTISPECIES: hypothetical protein [unclassified Bacillus (in: firmicutes)]SFC12724.1 hypothetical protein SAMN04488168_102116 [Bacillus sp. 491mf]